MLCEYGLQGPLIWKNKGSPPGSSSTGEVGDSLGSSGADFSTESQILGPGPKDPSPVHRNQPVLCAGLDCKALELIVNWFSSTVYTVTHNDEELLRICQTVVLKEAVSHRFLMHGLLALSALHLADRSSGKERGKYSRTAMDYHNQGLTMFRAELRSIKKSNYSAIIAFSSVTSIFSFALSRPFEKRSLSLLDDLSHIFQLAKGWHEVVRLVATLGVQAPTGTESTCKETFELPANARESFRRLHELNCTRAQNENQPHTEVYTKVIDSLSYTYGKLASGDPNPHAVQDLANMIPDRFFSLLSEHTTMALLIMGHYCVVLDHFKMLWWLNGWSSGLLEVIWHNVDSVNRPSLAWPLEVVGLSVLDLQAPGG